MTGGVWEESWAPVTGRVASTISPQQADPPANTTIVARDNPAHQVQEEVIVNHGTRGGDGGDPWVLVLIGKKGSGKSSTGNSILDSQTFKVEGRQDAEGEGKRHTSDMEIVDGVIPSINVPVKIVDTIGYGGVKDTNKENTDRLVDILQDHIHLVHAFFLVVNAEDNDQQHTFDLLCDYVEVFGKAILANLVVVVTHWSMSEGASKTRGTNGITREKFTEAWITTLGKRVPLKSEDMIPFVFLDNQVALKGSAHLTFDAIEQECFEASRCAIFQHLSACPVFSCVGLRGTLQSSSHASLVGYKRCSKCNRYFISVEEHALKDTSRGLACASQASVAAARIARVAQATSHAWTPAAAVKAMTRGWHGGAGGVHLFGRIAARAGFAAQIGFGVYRYLNAEDPTEKAKAAIGTGAGIVGGWGGATWGATVGTFLMPGVGTVLGGMDHRGLTGAVGLQAASEKCVDLLVPDVCLSCKKYEM